VRYTLNSVVRGAEPWEGCGLASAWTD